MNTMTAATTICDDPKCLKPHALVWRIGVKGKKTLGYFCDRTPVARNVKGVIVSCEHMAFKKMPKEHPEIIGEIGEFYTPQAKKEAAQKGQLTLVNVNPEGKLPESKLPVEDVNYKKGQLDAMLFKRDEIEKQIRSLESEKRKIQDEANALSAKISEMETFKLL